jgi:hypothetical protein
VGVSNPETTPEMQGNMAHQEVVNKDGHDYGCGRLASTPVHMHARTDWQALGGAYSRVAGFIPSGCDVASPWAQNVTSNLERLPCPAGG